MAAEGETAHLARRVSHAASTIDGTRPFWTLQRNNLLAQIQSSDCRSPNVFFTVSAADVQWPDLHRLMPGYDPDLDNPAHADSYRRHLKWLNENPALASYYFQKHWELFFELVLKKKFNIIDWWWCFEWQYRGSSHIHGFFWFADAPKVDELDFNNQEHIQQFIQYWDQIISTWHPDRHRPPAAIHPSAQLFPSLQDTITELAEMLNRFQRHDRCTPGYCERRRDGQKVCRFGFPFPDCNESHIQRLPGKTFPEYVPRRNDALLNTFNPLFILGWRANIDIRPVTNQESVVSYIAKYASKSEDKSQSYKDLLHSAISKLNDGDPAHAAYQKMLSSFVAEHDISGQEVCHVLLGCDLVSSSRYYRSLYVGFNTHQELNFETGELGVDQNSGIIKHYLKWPTTVEFEQMTLLDFAKRAQVQN